MTMIHDHTQNCDILAVLLSCDVFICFLFSVTRRLSRLWSYQTRGCFIHQPSRVPSITNHQVPVTIPGRPLPPTCQVSSFDWAPPSHISQVRFQRIKTKNTWLCSVDKKCGLIVIGCTASDQFLVVKLHLLSIWPTVHKVFFLKNPDH